MSDTKRVPKTYNSLPKGLEGKCTGELRQILIEALRRYNLPASWGSIDGKDVKNVRNPGLILERIDEVCNEFGLQVSDSGELFMPLIDAKRAECPTYRIEISEPQRALLERATKALINRGAVTVSQRDELEALRDMLEALPGTGKPGDLHGFTL